MTEDEVAVLIAEIEANDAAYADIHEVLISEEDLEDWTERERRAMRP